MQNSATSAKLDASQKSLEDQQENRIAARLLIGVVLVAALVAVAVVIWGLPALTMVGLGATSLVMLLLIAYAAGF